MYIYSKWSEKDLLHLSAVNGVADLYELLGIYISYCGDPSQDSFQDYYRNTVGKHPYHFRYIGELKVKHDLARNGIKVPRRDFRCFARTRKNIPIITSSNMGAILTELAAQLQRFSVTKEVLPLLEMEFSPQDVLYFQYYFVSKYVRVKGYASSFKKLPVFKKVLNDWETNILFS